MPDWDTMHALVAGAPDLAGARCRGRHELFDSTIPGRQEPSGKPPSRTELDNARIAALRICATCPALDPCRAWFDTLRPYRRPLGVTAGQVVRQP